MPEQTTHSHNGYRLRAKLPQYFRIAAIGTIAVIIFAVIVGFYRERSKSPFRLKSEHTQLSTDVVADVNGYERLETDGGLPKYLIKADSAKTFSDDHQELENVYIETYDSDGVLNDKMSAETALYVPETDRNFTAYMKGDVRIETPDELRIKTNNIVYTKKDETASADEAVEFERSTIRGRSLGATVKISEKVVELLKDVEIEAFESPELAKSNIRYAKVRSGSASFDQSADRIDLRDSVAINIESGTKSKGNVQTTDVRADRASVSFSGKKDGKSSQLNKFELFDDISIVSSESDSAPTNIAAIYALYDKGADRFKLKGGVRIVTAANDIPTDISASEAIYEQTARQIDLSDGGQITQGQSYLKGDLIHANLFHDRRIKNAIIRGNAAARQTTTESIITITAPELNATFNEARELHDASAIGPSNAEVVPNQNSEYTRLALSAAKGIGVVFKGPGMIDAMRTDGRTTIQLDAPDSADAANKRMTADVVRTIFNANGKDISRAEVVGDAELFIEPLHAAAKSYKTTINAPRFDCDFFPMGNNVRTCTGGRKTKTTRVPTVTEPGHGTQTLLADQLTAQFDERSRDIESLLASGGAKFNELDQNAVAAEMTYTRSDETVRFRGGDPTGWNSKYRAKAKEIDWDTRNQHSYLRGKVSTTYYSLDQIQNAAPFGKSNKPVFVTSDNAEFDQIDETAVYAGNARSWQENNYVRGDKFTLKQREGTFFAEGTIRSVAYNIKTNNKSGSASLPVFASANSLTYLRDNRLLQYRSDVDIRQGTDRITANSADVYLNEEHEVSKTVAQTHVVVTQPGRRGTGDALQYNAGDETAVLRGSPAVVEDAENGSSQAAQLTLYMREKRVVGEGRAKQSTASRIKSVYKVQGKQ